MIRKPPTRRPHQSNESGAAMLIAIFALLLISVVAIALVVSSGTDSSLAGNYRTATSAYYAGVAGLEEARGRLLWKNANYINISNSYSSLLSPSGLPTWGLTQVLYILNPNTAAGETVDPTNPANPYYDSEYGNEFNWGLGGAAIQTPLTSVSPVPTPALPGPAFKWVRINAITQQALNIDVSGTGSGTTDSLDMLYYDPAHVNSANQPAPSLVVSSVPSTPPTPTSVQALEITTLAVAPNGGKRLLQYVVAPVVISPDTNDQNFPAAVTLDDGQAGGAVSFNPPSGFQITGVDQCANPIPPLTPGVPVNSVASIGYSSSADQGYLTGQANPNKSIYTGAPVSAPPPPPYTAFFPSLWNVGPGAAPLPYNGPPLRQSWLQPASLDAAMQDIVNSADVIINGPATGSDIWNAAPGMATTPMTIVVKGDLTLNGGFGAPTGGNGLLLVTGTLTYHPTASWNGIILVVGQGQMLFAGHHGTGGIYGSVFVAQTRDASGNLLPSLKATFGPSAGSDPGNGITYNSCSVKAAQGPLSYKVLSFHEIPLTN
ncbi:MAG TPA: pilus assembly PilX N-terminal domain-containing protein [Verrucomicrobiae bacterium]|nr:pilus assembly PilX N-terminal domain-containing protein [Verrucomicrobiae bacterium]